MPTYHTHPQPLRPTARTKHPDYRVYYKLHGVLRRSTTVGDYTVKPDREIIRTAITVTTATITDGLGLDRPYIIVVLGKMLGPVRDSGNQPSVAVTNGDPAKNADDLEIVPDRRWKEPREHPRHEAELGMTHAQNFSSGDVSDLNHDCPVQDWILELGVMLTNMPNHRIRPMQGHLFGATSQVTSEREPAVGIAGDAERRPEPEEHSHHHEGSFDGYRRISKTIFLGGNHQNVPQMSGRHQVNWAREYILVYATGPRCPETRGNTLLSHSKDLTSFHTIRDSTMPAIHSVPIAGVTDVWRDFADDIPLALTIQAENPGIKFYIVEITFKTKDPDINAQQVRSATNAFALGDHPKGFTIHDEGSLPNLFTRVFKVGAGEGATLKEINMRTGPILHSSVNDTEIYRYNIMITEASLPRFNNALAGGINQESLQIHHKGATNLTNGLNAPLPGTDVTKLRSQLTIQWGWAKPVLAFEDTGIAANLLPAPQTEKYFLNTKNLGQIAIAIEKALHGELKGICMYNVSKYGNNIWGIKITAATVDAIKIRTAVEGTPFLIDNKLLHGQNGTGTSTFLFTFDQREQKKLIAVAEQKKATATPRTFTTTATPTVDAAQQERRSIKLGPTSKSVACGQVFQVGQAIDHVVSNGENLTKKDFQDISQHSSSFATVSVSTAEKAAQVLLILNKDNSPVWCALHLKSWADSAAQAAKTTAEAEAQLIVEASLRSAEKRKLDRLTQRLAVRSKKQSARFKDVLQASVGSPQMEAWRKAHAAEQAEVLAEKMDDYLDNQESTEALSSQMFQEKFRATAEDIADANEWYEPKTHYHASN